MYASLMRWVWLWLCCLKMDDKRKEVLVEVVVVVVVVVRVSREGGGMSVVKSASRKTRAKIKRNEGCGKGG